MTDAGRPFTHPAPDRSDKLSTRAIAESLRVTRDAITKRARAEGWEPAVQQRGRSGTHYAFGDLPEAVQATILLARMHGGTREGVGLDAAEEAAEVQRTALWREFEAADGWRKRIAAVRMDALMMLQRLRTEGLPLSRARAAVEEHYAAEGAKGIGVSSLKRWGRVVKGKPRNDWMAYLLPSPRKARPRDHVHPAAFAAFASDYLRLEQPAGESCYRRLKRQAKANPEWGALPSLKTFERRLREEYSPAQITLRREGEEALSAMGPKIRMSRVGLSVMERVNADGHKFDVFVEFPDGSINRPMLVGWQDIASGKMLSHRIGKTETSDLVRLSFCDMVREYGIPQFAHLDNGRAFASKANTGGMPTRYRYKVKPEDPQGVINRIGTQVCWVTPYNGKAKPIERAWRDFAQDISRRPEFAGAYVGNSPEAKPDNYRSRAVPFDEFVRVVADGIAEHNAREGRRADVCEGRSFDATFAAGYSVATVQRATAQQLTLLLLSSDVVKVDGSTSEVRLAGNRYWSECLAPFMGERIELRFDPDQLHSSVQAFALDGTHIGAVPCICAWGWGKSDQMREAIRAQRDWKKKHKAERAAALAVEAAFASAPAPAIAPAQTPSAAVTRLFSPKAKPRPESFPRPAEHKQAPLSAELIELFKKGLGR